MKYCTTQSIIEQAYSRIKPYIYETPIIFSHSLNKMLGHQIYFKIESFQKTGAFKVRGVLNHLLELKERNQLPKKVVAYSTGNHGIGVAWVADLLGISARVYLPKYTSKIKQQAVNYYGAEVIFTDSRSEAENLTYADQENGFYYLHPSDSDSTIAGAGTACYEALKQLSFSPDAIFAACGGGGLLSGTYLSKKLLSPSTELIGVEPLQANDAFLSLKNDRIFRFSQSPETIADGLRTLGISDRTFHYIKQLDDLILVDEDRICYWTAWLTHLLKVVCEPSSALNMEAVNYWLSKQSGTQKVLVIISGGNISPIFYQKIANYHYLLESPTIVKNQSTLSFRDSIRV